MRIRVRSLPWVLAVAGLAIPLAGSGFSVWPLVLIWLVVLVLRWFVGGALVPTRQSRIIAGTAARPILFVLGWVGGWWLIPADIAWLVSEVADRGLRQHSHEGAMA